MHISFNSSSSSVHDYSNNPKFTPAPSFKMKMSELKGIDQFVARKYNINPQQKIIKTLNDFQKKCKDLVDDIAERASKGNFFGRQQETQIQRKSIIKEWYEYITSGNGAYTSAMALMILGGITAGLKPKEDTLPPVLNKGVLANTVEEINRTIPENPDDNAVSFDKKYRLNLQKALMSEENALDKSLNGWIIIPSKEHDSEHFEANIDKLKMLSHDHWCTKSFNAEPYLKEGDFHIYMEHGKPKLGVRFVGEKIEEIQGELNNSKIPVRYSDIAEEHIRCYKLTDNAKNEVEHLEKVKEKVEQFKTEKFPNGIEKASAQEIIEAFGIKCKKDKDGLLIISHFAEPKDFLFADLGIDENRLLRQIKIIEGNVYFNESIDTLCFSNLEKIGGNLRIGSDSPGYCLPKLKEIGGNLTIKDFYTDSLFELQKVGGNLIINGCNMIREFVKLEEIGGNLDIHSTEIESLGMLKKIGGNAIFNKTLKDIGLLEEIGGNADLEGNRELSTLKNLIKIGGDLYMEESEIRDLGQLKYVGGDVFFNDYLTVEDFKNNNVIVKGDFDRYPYNEEDLFENLNEFAKDYDEHYNRYETKSDDSDIFPDELGLFDDDPLYDDWSRY